MTEFVLQVGKSKRIDQFVASVGGVCLLAREESKTLQLRRFLSVLMNIYLDNFLKKNGFSDLDSFLNIFFSTHNPES